MSKIACVGKMFALVLFVLSANVAQAGSTFAAQVGQPADSVSRYGEFVIAAILKDMGLEFKGGGKREGTEPPDDKESKKPEPKKPEPKKNDDDFWSEDDDFFDSDKSFADLEEGFEKEYQDTKSAWDKEYEETVAKWNKAKKVYNKEKEDLAGATYDVGKLSEPVNLQAPSTVSSAVSLDNMKPGDYYVIPYSLDADVRNQGFRGTCAAFAGVRGLETVLKQHQRLRALNIDLSEQHFFWMSRPDCINKPCTEKDGDGSLFDVGLLHSKEKDPRYLVQLEIECPYQPYPNSNNLTYTPLNNCGSKGVFAAEKFHNFLKLDDVPAYLAMNQPVVAAFKLTNSYKESSGLVKLVDPRNKSQATGKHVAGHAMLLVGFVKLPESLWQNEGRYCAIMTNSWGVGFGVGGHACLTEKWMEANRFAVNQYPERSVLTAIESVSSVK